MASLAQPRAQIQPGPRWLAKESQREALAGYLFILPIFLGYTAFILGPIVAAVGISFTKYDILTPASFVGLENYARLFSDPRLRTVYGNTIFFTVFAVSLNVGIGLLLAVLLNRHIPGPLKYVFRSAYFFPVLVALVYSSIIWQFLYQKDTGIINYYLGLLNIEPIAWLGNKQWVLPSIIIMDVWRNTGFAMLVFLAGLQNISTEYYEAAQLDGAHRLAGLGAQHLDALRIARPISRVGRHPFVEQLLACGSGDAAPHHRAVDQSNHLLQRDYLHDRRAPGVRLDHGSHQGWPRRHKPQPGHLHL